MKIARIGVDYIVITEKNLLDEAILAIPRIHLIKFEFSSPSKEKVDGVLTLFSKTNRFVISDQIKFYNDILKRTSKKYYVMNNPGDQIITFFRKNNKVLLNFSNLAKCELDFITCPTVLPDVLKNVEVIQLDRKDFNVLRPQFETWDGNVIINE